MITLPALPVPSSAADREPIERAVVDDIAAEHDPETFLWIVFRRPDGGARVWYNWTSGGDRLGDHIDVLATARGMDAADWFAITRRHLSEHTHGRIRIHAHPLRPILADVQTGRGDDGTVRDELGRVAAVHAAYAGYPTPPVPLVPRWVGTGPILLNRRDGR